MAEVQKCQNCPIYTIIEKSHVFVNAKVCPPKGEFTRVSLASFGPNTTSLDAHACTIEGNGHCQLIGNSILPHFDPSLSSLALLEAEISLEHLG